MVPVVLIHGMGSSARAWDVVVPLLESRQPVHAVTLDGHHGGRPLVLGKGSFAERLVLGVERELDELGIERAHLVGNSLGGWVAMRLAERGRAASVTCLAPAGGWVEGSLFDRLLAMRFAGAYLACRSIQRWAPGILTSPRARRLLMRQAVADPDAVSSETLRHIVEDRAGCSVLWHAVGHPARRTMRSIDHVPCPLLVAWGTDDVVLPRAIARVRFADVLASAEELEVAGFGHVPMLERPAEVAELVLDFLDRAFPASVAG